MASAVSRMRASLMSHANLFQLFHPMGGVGATTSPTTARAAAPPAAPARREAVAHAAARRRTAVGAARSEEDRGRLHIELHIEHLRDTFAGTVQRTARPHKGGTPQDGGAS